MAKKVKLFHVVEAFGGGVFSLMSEIIKFSDTSVFDITIVHSLRRETPPNYRDFFPAEVKLIYLPMVREISPSSDFKALLALFRIFVKERPDVIHLHSSKAGILGRIAARLAGRKKLFYSAHGFSFLRTDVSPGKRRLYFVFEAITSLFGKSIVALSTDELKYARKLSRKTVLIPNGVDLDLIAGINAPDANGDNVKIGISGRITAARAPKTFCKIASALSSKTVKFIWIGDGELRDAVEKTCAEVEISGWKSRPESIRLVSDLDIYVQTSLWEGMPVSVLEAMALGKPIVASNIVGNRDLVIHGRNGYLAETEEDFVRYVRVLAEDPGLRKRMGEESRRLAYEKYDIRKIVKQYEALYLGRYEKLYCQGLSTVG